MKRDFNSIPRPEHPDPQWERKNWKNLNGEWQFEIDNAVSGKDRGLHKADRLQGKIMVPFCPESSLSGIQNTDFMLQVWYKKIVEFDYKAQPCYLLKVIREYRLMRILN